MWIFRRIRAIYSDSPKERILQVFVMKWYHALMIAVLFPLVIGIFVNLIILTFPSKPDGELWISDNGSRFKTTYYGHYEIQCLCKYLTELNYSCADRYMGCGAVNCECFNWTARLQNDLGAWKSYHSGAFVRGEGLVCK